MNYRMDISYDGTKYKGWQRQKSTGNTIQGKIEETLTKYLETKIKITGASRTDAGVHARMQVINFEVDKELDTDMLRVTMNKYLPASIVVNKASIVDDRFHSRFNAVKKVYKYCIWRSDAKYPPLFERKYTYCYDGQIDIEKMKSASRKFIGKHDFKGFSSDKTKKATVRDIEEIKITSDEFKIEIEIVGSGFLYNMVRVMVGTLIEISTGEMEEGIIDRIFSTQSRELAGFTVPASGLFLEKVIY